MGHEQDRTDGEVEYAPNAKTEGGLMCFLDRERECGSECMAFLGFGQEVDSNHLTQQQCRCVLISSAERAGRFAGLIAKVLYDDSVAAKKAHADEKRAAETPPTPGPMGQPAKDQRTP